MFQIFKIRSKYLLIIVLSILAISNIFAEEKNNMPVRYRGFTVKRLDIDILKNAVNNWNANQVRYMMCPIWETSNRARGQYQATWRSMIEKLPEGLENAKALGIATVIDLHQIPNDNPKQYSNDKHTASHEYWYDESNLKVMIECWREIAEICKGRDQVIWFDLLNEPLDWTTVHTSLAFPPTFPEWAQKTIDAIRKIDRIHPIAIEPGPGMLCWGFKGFPVLNDKYQPVIYSVHMYQPVQYTHQGVNSKEILPWPGVFRDSGGGYWNKERLEKELAPAIDYQKKNGVRIYVGEFSAPRFAPDAEIYLRECLEIFEKLEWDWNYHALNEASVWDLEKNEEVDLYNAEGKYVKTALAISNTELFYATRATAPINPPKLTTGLTERGKVIKQYLSLNSSKSKNNNNPQSDTGKNLLPGTGISAENGWSVYIHKTALDAGGQIKLDAGKAVAELPSYENLNNGNFQIIKSISVEANKSYKLKFNAIAGKAGEITAAYLLSKAPYTKYSTAIIPVAAGENAYECILDVSAIDGNYDVPRSLRLLLGAFKDTTMTIQDISFSEMTISTTKKATGAPIKKMLVLGDSITQHGPKESLGWTGQWGMAASSESKDYVHLLYSKISASQKIKPELILNGVGGGTIDKTIASLPAIIAHAADFVIIQLGENDRVLTEDGFEKPYERLIASVKQANSSARVYCCGTWKSVPQKDEIIKSACQRQGAVFVDIKDVYADPSASAASEKRYTNSGVNWHPGDKGMQGYANVLWKAMQEQPVMPESQKVETKITVLENTGTIFEDDFENGNVKNWQPDSFVFETGITKKALAITAPDAKGNTIKVSLPAASLCGRTVKISAMIKAENVSDKPKPHNGIKFMLSVTDAEGRKDYPQAAIVTGTFDWKKVTFTYTVHEMTVVATLVCGLDSVSGKVLFDDVKIEDITK
ncbi:MAG: hypothetical protein A2096_14540 [Spirochaetes bacterium GWF1_41_5]|nr:MAG: hypothetical protein A2096_14540 [Spirochaetes bacterium GWF1_41_5]HBE02073.1 hypothetical protein [Spirochaetia bacterium]